MPRLPIFDHLLATSTSFLGPKKATNDFLRWREQQSAPVPLEAPDVVPVNGIRPQEEVWGNWGSKATIGDRREGQDTTRMPACDDAEAQPPPPCEATGECGDLLKDARRMEGAAKRSEQLMQNAVAAMQASKAMLKQAEVISKNILRDPSLSVLADEDVNHHYDLASRMLWGPWDHAEPPYEPYHTPNETHLLPEVRHDATSSVLVRLTERQELDARAVEYLNLVEAQTAGPSSFSPAASLSLTVAAPFQQPASFRHRRRSCKAGESGQAAQLRSCKLSDVRRARLEAFLQVL